MAARRFTLGKDGLLRDRKGAVLGRLTGISVDLAKEFSGGVGVEEGYIPREGLGTNPQITLDGGAGETDPHSISEQVAQVWRHYQAVVSGGARFVLEEKRRTIIRNALKVRPLDQVLAAIDGLSRSSHHNGHNDRRKKYLGIHYALQGIGAESNDERIDKMGDIARQHPATGVVATLPSAGREMVRERERHIKQSLANPGDESLRQRADFARAWFAEAFGLTEPSVDPSDGNAPLRWKESGFQ